MTQINISNRHTNLARPNDHRGPPARPSCADKRPHFKPQPSDVLRKLSHLRPKIIYLISAAIIIPFVINSLFDSQILLAPTNGLVSIPFAILSLLTSIIASAILETDASFHPNGRGTSVLEALILAGWPMAPATYFVRMADTGSSDWAVLVTAMMVHACMVALIMIAMVAYMVATLPSEADEEAAFREAFMKAARKAAREVALEASEEASEEASVKGILLHTNAAPDCEKIID